MCLLYGPLVAVVRLFIVLIQLQQWFKILKHFTPFVSELQRFLSRLCHKRAITIDGNRQCTWHNSTLCTSPLPHFAICPCPTLTGNIWIERTHFQFFISALTKSSQPFLCSLLERFFDAFRANFCLLSGLVWARLGLQHHSSTIVLVTGLGHCLLPFPVRGAAYANIFNMIAFLYFDFMRSLCCVGRVWGVGAWPAHITNIIEKIVFIKCHNLCNEITD